MAQIQSPTNYVNGDQVTAANLNNHINGAVVLPGVILDQSALTANTLAAGDSLLIYDTSATGLRRILASDILGSALAVTTNAIGSTTGNDLVLTPAASQKVDVAGLLEADDITVTDDLSVTGDTTLSGPVITSSTITANGASTFVGNVIVDNGLTSNGTANFTGTFQFNGSAVYALSEIVEENIAKFTATNNAQLYSVFTSNSYTKAVGEIWVIELDYTIMSNATGRSHYRLTNSADTTVYQMRNAHITSSNQVIHFSDRFYLDSATTYSGTFVLRNYNAQAGAITNPLSADYTAASYQGYDTVSKFRIYKYKTA